MEGVRPMGRTRKTWLEVVNKDLKGLGSASVDVLDLGPQLVLGWVTVTEVCLNAAQKPLLNDTWCHTQ